MALLTLLVMTSVLALGALLFTQGLICTCTSGTVNLSVEYQWSSDYHWFDQQLLFEPTDKLCNVITLHCDNLNSGRIGASSLPSTFVSSPSPPSDSGTLCQVEEVYFVSSSISSRCTYSIMPQFAAPTANGSLSSFLFQTLSDQVMNQQTLDFRIHVVTFCPCTEQLAPTSEVFILPLPTEVRWLSILAT